MNKVTLAIICIFDVLLVLVIIACVIGLLTAEHMRKVAKETNAIRNEKISAIEQTVNANSQADKDNLKQQQLATDRANQLAKLSKDITNAEAQARVAQEKIMADDLQAATAEVIVAPPTAEKYITNPQYTLNFYNDNNLRAYNDNNDNKTFKEKFEALTKDGIVTD